MTPNAATDFKIVMKQNFPGLAKTCTESSAARLLLRDRQRDDLGVRIGVGADEERAIQNSAVTIARPARAQRRANRQRFARLNQGASRPPGREHRRRRARAVAQANLHVTRALTADHEAQVSPACSTVAGSTPASTPSRLK